MLATFDGWVIRCRSLKQEYSFVRLEPGLSGRLVVQRRLGRPCGFPQHRRPRPPRQLPWLSPCEVPVLITLDPFTLSPLTCGWPKADWSLRGVPPSGNRGRREASRRPESRLDGHDTPRFFYRQTEMHIPVKGIVAASRKPL